MEYRIFTAFGKCWEEQADPRERGEEHDRENCIMIICVVRTIRQMLLGLWSVEGSQSNDI
jgi:hypothetical protein